MPGHNPSSSPRSPAHPAAGMGPNLSLLPDMGQRRQNNQHPPRTYRSPTPVNYSPGYMVMLPRLEQLRKMRYRIPEDIDPKIFNHPALILREDTHSVVIALVTSHKSRDFKRLDPYIQLQHLPIGPTEPAKTGEQLQMAVGNLRRPNDSYIKAHETFTLPKWIIVNGNIDEQTRAQLSMKEESLEYVNELVLEYQTRAPSPWQWRAHKSCRPFPGYSAEVFPNGYPRGSSTSDSSASSESQRNSVSSNTTTGSDEQSAADKAPADSLLPDSGTATDNGVPSTQDTKPPPSLPPRPEILDTRGAYATWPTQNNGYPPWERYPSRPWEQRQWWNPQRRRNPYRSYSPQQ